MRCRDFVLAAKAGNKIKNFAERAMPEAQKGSIFFQLCYSIIVNLL